MFYFLLLAALANNDPAIIINEIAWMGSEASHANEWIELKNNTNQEINLDGWIVEAADGTPKINLTGKIPADGFYLLERSKNYTGALENNGEILELHDSSGGLIDKIDASSGWLAGDNDTKQTMEKTGLRWQTSQNPGGTPKAKNSKLSVQPKQQIAAVSKPLEPFNLIQGKQTQSEQITASSKSLYVFFTASALAIFSGAIILLLKKKLSC